MNRETEEAEKFLGRQIAWGHEAIGLEIDPQLKWILANHDLKPEQQPSPGLARLAMDALSKAWDQGPEGIRSKDGASSWQKHVGQLLRGPASTGSRVILAGWLREKAPGSLPEDKIIFDIGGFGTGLFGMDDLREDRTYLATKFIVALGVPIVPLATFRVKEGARSLEMGMAMAPRSYEVVEKHPVRWAQAFRGWAFSIVCVSLIIVSATLVERARWGIMLFLASLMFPWASQMLYRRLVRRHF